jgi:hypothetical protein
MFKREIKRRWGLTAARAWARLLIERIQVKSSQVKLLITYNAFFIVQRATAQSKIEVFRDYGVAEAGFQAGWSDCMYFFSLFLFILFAHLGFPCKFLNVYTSWDWGLAM